MNEILSKRTFTQKQYELGNNQFRMQAHIGDIHYRDGALKNGAFQDIDTTLVYNNASQTYHMTNASYEAEIGLLGNVRFYHVDHSIEFALTNPSNVQATAYNGSAFGNLGKGLIWNNILGNGGHQIVEVRNGSLAKIFRFDVKPSTNVISFRVSISGGVKLLRDNIELRPLLQEIRTTGVLNLEYNGRISWIRKPKAWNHRGEYSDIELRWYRSGTNIYVDKIIPQSFIDNTFTEQGAWLECDTTISYYTGPTTEFFFDLWGVDWTTIRNAGTCNAVSGPPLSNALVRNYPNPSPQINRVFFSINTSGLPDMAIISAATMNIYSWYHSAGGPGEWVIQQNLLSNPESATVDDYDSITLNTPVEATTSRMVPTELTMEDFVFNSNGISFINKTGWTQLCLRGGKDVDNVNPDAQLGSYWHFSDTANDPYLTVDFMGYIPAITLTNGTIRHISSRVV